MIKRMTIAEAIAEGFLEGPSIAPGLDVVRADDKQVGGTHYKDLEVTPWEAMEAWMSPEAFKGFLMGNIIRYLARTKDNVREDHKKAAHYLQKLIEVEDAEK
jgi:hypothetical protein